MRRTDGLDFTLRQPGADGRTAAREAVGAAAQGARSSAVLTAESVAVARREAESLAAALDLDEERAELVALAIGDADLHRVAAPIRTPGIRGQNTPTTERGRLDDSD